VFERQSTGEWRLHPWHINNPLVRSIMKSSFFVAAVVFLLLAAGGQAQAAILGLVFNGDFEDPVPANPLDPNLPIPGWKDIGSTLFNGIESANQHGGSQAAYFGPVGGDPVGPAGGIEQDLSTAAGHSYLLTFWLRNDAGDFTSRQPQTFFSVNWGGSQLMHLSNVSSFGYGNSPNPFSFVVTAAGATTTLQFEFQNNDGFFDLDDVSVTPIDANAVPEPASLAIWALGIVGFGLARRRRTKTIC
jgi:PEP-CTERM motif-containing protein